MSITVISCLELPKNTEGVDLFSPVTRDRERLRVFHDAVNTGWDFGQPPRSPSDLNVRRYRLRVVECEWRSDKDWKSNG